MAIPCMMPRIQGVRFALDADRIHWGMERTSRLIAPGAHEEAPRVPSTPSLQGRRLAGQTYSAIACRRIACVAGSAIASRPLALCDSRVPRVCLALHCSYQAALQLSSGARLGTTCNENLQPDHPSNWDQPVWEEQ